MPIYREFIVEESEVVNGFGLRPTWMLDAEAGSPSVVAHDMLEHFQLKPQNQFEDELMALGALYMLRYESGAIPVHYGYGGLHAALASALQETLSDMLTRVDLPLPRRLRVHNLCDEDAGAQTCMEKAVELVFRGYSFTRKGLDAYDQAVASGVLYDLERDPREVLALKRSVLAWVLKGYRRAKARYAKADAYTVGTHLFANIERAAARVLRDEGMEEGTRVRISVDVNKTLDINVRILDRYSTRWVKVHSS